MTQPDLITVEHLKMYFPVEAGLFQQSKSFIHAVDDISFRIPRGESLSLVGESGCGKTTTGKILVKLYEPTSGKVLLQEDSNAIDLGNLKKKDMRAFRKKVQMIFQDPYESLNPHLTIFDTIAEPLNVQNIGNIIEREHRVAEMLALVGLTPPSSFIFRYPHELSGGQRQRVAIARALVVKPTFVVADEPTSMLDVSIRTGIMNLMLDIASRMNVSYLYITHDLAVARYMSKNIAVMYLGKIVEMGDTEAILADPSHPYTRALISAVAVPDPRVQREVPNIKGGVTAPIDPPARCRFFDRCPIADDYCKSNEHPPLEKKKSGQLVACYKV